jgi:hypothetical protein
MSSIIEIKSIRYVNRSSRCSTSTCHFINLIPNNLLYAMTPFSFVFFSINSRTTYGKQILHFNYCISSQSRRPPFFITKNAHRTNLWFEVAQNLTYLCKITNLFDPSLLKFQVFQTMHIDLNVVFDQIKCMFWLETKILNEMGLFWLINFTMMIDLIICQIAT